MYRLSYSKQAIKALKKMPKNTAKRIMDKLALLKVDPYTAPQVKVAPRGEVYK